MHSFKKERGYIKIKKIFSATSFLCLDFKSKVNIPHAFSSEISAEVYSFII